ncbi:MAG: undecaprenyl/decaprenyl-phosphate alpha-N-acetylglucosaminyl 1-phosphate transferase [Candidatus Dormibacteria bacterium]
MLATAAWLPALPPFLLASVVCIPGVVGSMWLAQRLGAVARPDDARHLHAQPTPRLGGLAMFAGFATAVLVFGGGVAARWPLLIVCGAVTVAMAVDDVVDLPWWQKLIIIAGAGVALFAMGINIPFIALPGGHLLNLGWLAFPATVLWVSGMQVSINFLDGSDGVAAGVVAIVAVITMLAAINRVSGPGDVQSGVIVLSGALMGCCTGFLVFNLPPARVFMGDSGANFLGVALAVITIVGVAKVAVGLSILVPIVALGVPISDTAFAIVRRRRAGVSPATPDAGHLHHRLKARGMSAMETALTFYLATGVLGALGLAIFGHRKILDVAIVLLALGVFGLLYRNHRRQKRVEPGAVAGRPAAADHEQEQEPESWVSLDQALPARPSRIDERD